MLNVDVIAPPLPPFLARKNPWPSKNQRPKHNSQITTPITLQTPALLSLPPRLIEIPSCTRGVQGVG